MKAYVPCCHIEELEENCLGLREHLILTEVRRVSTFRDGGNRERHYRRNEVCTNGEHFGIISLAFMRIYKNS